MPHWGQIRRVIALWCVAALIFAIIAPDSLSFFPVYSDLVGGGTYSSDKIMAAFATTMQSTKLTPMTPKWVEVSRNKTVTQAMNSSVMKGQKTVEQATADAATEIEGILNSK